MIAIGVRYGGQAFDAADGMLDSDAHACFLGIEKSLPRIEGLALGFLFGLKDGQMRIVFFYALKAAIGPHYHVRR